MVDTPKIILSMRNEYRTLYKTMRDGELFCVLIVIVEDMKLTIRRVDFQEWEMNRRDGRVEVAYSFDEGNTSRFCELLMANSTSDFFKKLKSGFGSRIGHLGFVQNLLDFCKANDIEYYYSVWY